MSEKKMPKVGFVSLGCPKNLVDSEVMLGTLAGQGYSITPHKEDADIIVVNTCGFIDSAKKESIDTILEMAELKTQGNCKKLVVAGCLAERYRAEIQKEIPEIDFIFGPDELGRVLEAVQLDSSAAVPDVSIDALYTSKEVPTIPRILTTPSYMAYLKISEGCDHVCSFCAIPGFRGRFRSRSVPDLVAESRRLAEQGVRELVIVSQDTMAYGRDIGLPDGITALLRELVRIDGLQWVRFLYCYPNMVSDDLVRLVAEEDRLCKYFDIPYQHASRNVLDRMRRGGNRSMFERQIDAIRRLMPGAGLRTSFIVGFPGETEGDFNEVLTFVNNVQFDNVGVFLYSDEEGTGAFDLDSKVLRRVAARRRNQLMKQQAKLSTKKLRSMIGRTLEVLLEGRSDESDLLLQGRMETQAPEIDGHVLINDSGDIEPVMGEFYKVEITDSLEYDLIGKMGS
ncbi:MAG: ribosomal protein S12 methylthiotransferase RimO [Acidobacteria bacterium 13_1_20CM_2_57_8]|nr:MAG: ribosomal protein S12 methylthiotransferase RimO [Acidobacteria bacterium 13_1_20CM_2_57_8]